MANITDSFIAITNVFKDLTPDERCRMFELLEMLYCRNCGYPQPLPHGRTCSCNKDE